ncbi:TnsA-like heteromeric transposase endonuclease subunit [Streptomyces sp. NPDC057428]|uniref:TnsA-like heteromeric transposase endonuclease subunit n=1 Tax=Streptomyces sp. NPDC057428 TaxID=3346129 RepID=UPI00368D7668
MAAVRPFRWSRGDRHFSGWYWAATTGRHVGFESWLERDRLSLTHFDPEVTGIASQPFWLHRHDGERERRHAPDCFVRRTDGSATVVDVRADERIEPKDAEAFEITRLACGQAGWGFKRVGVPEAVPLANAPLSRRTVRTMHCGTRTLRSGPYRQTRRTRRCWSRAAAFRPPLSGEDYRSEPTLVLAFFRALPREGPPTPRRTISAQWPGVASGKLLP